MTKNIQEKINKLPGSPGVYMFRDKDGKLLYIGKATHLRNRVRSYFHDGMRANRPIETMIHEVADIETRTADSVLEALILESNLIKKFQPKYNIKEKDDKSFSYSVITKEEFPRVLIMRKTELDKISNFKFQIQNKFKISHAYGPYTSKKQMQIGLKIIRKIFPFHSIKQQTEKGCLDFQMGRCPGPYAGAISREDYLKNIRGIRLILEGKKKNLVRQLKKEMAEYSKKQEYEKAQEAKGKIFALQHIRDVALIVEDKIEEPLAGQALGGEPKPLRIEAYDISNISGSHAVGSMVVFAGHEPDKSQYRKFKIKTIEGANDVGMMREVLLRRFGNDWPKPNLILLDGGQGHVNMGDNILRSFGLDIPIVGVAKGPSRKNLNFKFQISNAISTSKFQKEINKILEDKKLIKQIMDEAHRFAITYHRKVRGKKMLI